MQIANSGSMRARTARSSSKASSDESGRRPNRTRVVLGRIALGLIMLGGCGGAGGHGDGPVAATSSDVASSLAVHGCSGDDTSASGFDHLVSAGCNVIDRSAFRKYLDALPRGAKGKVWLGNYDNSTCSWEKSDDWIRSHVPAIAGHPAIGVYELADVPHVWDCPSAPAQFKERSDLVRSIDPGVPTFAVIEPRAGENPYSPYVGTVDIIGADRYPCTYKHGCVMSKIDETIRLLDEAGVPRYWVAVQAFADVTHRLPSADELREEFQHWRQSRMEGYLVFSWDFGSTQLDDHP